MKKIILIKKEIIISVLLIFSISQSFCQVGIGTTSPTDQSALDIRTTDKGLLIPRLTTAQRTTLAAALTTANDANNKGMQVYDTETNTVWFWNNTNWKQVADTSLIPATSISCINYTGGPLSPKEILYVTLDAPSQGSYYTKYLFSMQPSEAKDNPVIGFVSGTATIAPLGVFNLETTSIAEPLSGLSIVPYTTNDAIWYRPSMASKWGLVRDQNNPSVRIGNAYNSGGTQTNTLASFTPKWFNPSASVTSVYKPILDNTVTTSVNASIGRYIVPATGLSGDFVGQANKYADYDGVSFVFSTPTSGDKVTIIGGTNIGVVYTYTGGVWVKKSQTTPLPTDNYLVTNAYNANDLVVYNSALYQANGAVPANTTFAIGTTGATWKQIGISGAAEYGSLSVTKNPLGGSAGTPTVIGTFTLPSAGTYQITYNLRVGNNGIGISTYAWLKNGSGTQVAGSIKEQWNGTAESLAGTMSTTVIVTTTGAETYTLVGYQSGYVDIRDGSNITWNKIAGYLPVVTADPIYGSSVLANGYYALGTTYQNIITATIPSAGVWDITYIANGDAGLGGGVMAALKRASGSIEPESEIFCIYTNGGGDGSATGRVFITTTGAEVIALVAKRINTVGANIYSAASGTNKIIYLKIK